MNTDAVCLPTDAKSLADPYGFYTNLRRSNPVAWDERHKFWLISRHEDVLKVLLNYSAFSSRVPPMSELGAPIMMAEDPPNHTRLRRLVQQAFTPRRIAELEPRITDVTVELMASMKTLGSRFDVVKALSYPLPVIVIAELLGVPSENRDDIWRWSHDFIKGLEKGQQWAQAIAPTLAKLHEYFDAAIESHIQTPRDDLIGALLLANSVEDGRLSEGELFNMCLLLLIAGHETTTNLISNAIAAMIRFPSATDRLRRNPSLAGPWIEETLRWDSSVRVLNREATQDTTLNGAKIRCGQRLLLILASANRDEDVFDSPDEFIPERDPHRNIGFGFGRHSCLASSLARMEATIALKQFVANVPKFALDPNIVIEREDLLFAHGYRSLPIMLDEW